VTKVRVCKGAGQKGSLGVTFHAPGNAKEWGNEPSHSQVNFHLESWSLEWTFKFSENDCKGQNSMEWGVPYIIGKLLELKCSKWAHIGHFKHKLWSKERPRVQLVVWLLTTKSLELTQFPCMQVSCDILLKISRQGLQLCFRLHRNQRSARKVMGPQSFGDPNCGNFGTPKMGVLGQNVIWTWAS
jgi:hypothetical protein